MPILGHDARQPRHLRRMREDVLPVARSELQAAHQTQDLRVEIVQAELECDGSAFLSNLLVGLVLHLLDDLFDACRMNPAVRDEALDRFFRDLATVWIEAGENDRAGRVVDDEIDARGELQRADVAALAADDPALHVVAREVDH
jgi:hypothetical protein